MYYERELRPKWHVPAALMGAAAMMAVSLELRGNWEDHPVSVNLPPAITTTMAPPTTEVIPSTTSTSTTTPEILRRPISLASGPLIKGSGMLFDKKRASGVDCTSSSAASRINVLRLPLDLGQDSVTRNPLAEIDRVVFLGHELSRSVVSYTLTDGLALVLDGDRYKLFSFEVKAVGVLLAEARGTLVKSLDPGELRGSSGISFSTETLAFGAKINSEIISQQQLELTIRCK